MAKLTLTDLANLQNETSAVASLNNNNTAIEVAMEKTLSRDGTTPNQMEVDLDLNSNDIINGGVLRAQDIILGGENAPGLLTTLNGLADSATASAAAAAISETNAGNSETSAATSASNAFTSETNAATSASNASTSETNAAASETQTGLDAVATAADRLATGNDVIAASGHSTNAAAFSVTASNHATGAGVSASEAAASAASAALAINLLLIMTPDYLYYDIYLLSQLS